MLQGGANFVETHPSSVVDRRYVVRREIARGGMSIVQQAEHQWLRAPVALKTLDERSLESRTQHARVLREARALSLVRHPNVVSVLDAGVCPNHGPFVALELFDARSLASFLVARQRLDPAEVVHVGLQIGSALAHANTRGVIHRDVKPANVLIGRAPGQPGDVAKLIDFGIAQVRGEDDVLDRKLTDAHEVLGTVEYMAPEQLLHGMAATAASDVYGLGALLYECLVGDVPIAGNALVVMTHLLQGVRPRPIRSVRDDVPAQLEAAILRALDIDPAVRQATASELAAACAAAYPSRGELLSMHQGAARVDAEIRRQWVRAPYVTPARVIGAHGAVDGRTEDISEGGLLVVTASPCEEGERVMVRLPLPRGGHVETLEAIARWTRTRRGQRALGLEFVALPDAARAEIRSYVDLMTPQLTLGAAHPPR